MSSSEGKSLTKRIIEFLKQYPGSRPSEIAEYLGVSRALVYRILSYLKSRGIVKKVGSGYVLAKSVQTDVSEGSSLRVAEGVEQRGATPHSEGISKPPRSFDVSLREKVVRELENLSMTVKSLEKELESLAKLAVSIVEALSKASTSFYSSNEQIMRIVSNAKVLDLETAVKLLKAMRLEDLCSEFVVIGDVAIRKQVIEEARREGFISELERVALQALELGQYEDLCLYL